MQRALRNSQTDEERLGTQKQRRTKDQLFIIPLIRALKDADALIERWLNKGVEEAVEELSSKDNFTATNGSDIKECCSRLTELQKKAKVLISELEALEQIPSIKAQGEAEDVPYQCRTGIEADSSGRCRRVILPKMNESSGTHFSRLPDFGQLRFLIALNLNYSGLQKMDTVSMLPKCIEEIHLRGNRIRSHIKGFEELENITLVDLNENQLEGCFPWSAIDKVGSLDHRTAADDELKFFVQNNMELILPKNVERIDNVNKAIIKAFSCLEKAMTKRETMLEQAKGRGFPPPIGGIRFKCQGVAGSCEEGLHMAVIFSETLEMSMKEWFGEGFVENKLYRYLKMEPTSERFGGKRFDFDPMITWRTLGMQENDELEFILDLERVEYEKWCLALGFHTKDEYERCLAMGFEAKDEMINGIWASTRKMILKSAQLGFNNKQQYDDFRASPDYADLKELQIATAAEYYSFKSRPDYRDLKMLREIRPIKTKAEYDQFRDEYEKSLLPGVDTKEGDDDNDGSEEIMSLMRNDNSAALLRRPLRRGIHFAECKWKKQPKFR